MLDPILDRIFVASFGQPDRSAGGILMPDDGKQFWRYRQGEWRYGEVIAIGPGQFNQRGERLPMPNIKVGDTVAFSRRHGSRLPGDERYDHPKYGPLLIRVLDPEKCQAIVTGLEPWWDVQASQIDPSQMMSG